jgi:hypothetical protein
MKTFKHISLARIGMELVVSPLASDVVRGLIAL